MKTIPTNTGTSYHFDGHPDRCPYCHRVITPNLLFGHRIDNIIEVLMACPNNSCKKGFIGYFSSFGNHFKFNGRVSQGNLIGKDFSENIKSISALFATIYNQAYSAEQQNLTEICGVGYRKSLEFLIKDYAIHKHPDDKDRIEKKLLGSCISEYINNSRITSVAKRATWLGNDETHYVRKWEGKNLTDLKTLIELTVHWIEMEMLTDGFEKDMPE